MWVSQVLLKIDERGGGVRPTAGTRDWAGEKPGTSKTIERTRDRKLTEDNLDDESRAGEGGVGRGGEGAAGVGCGLQMERGCLRYRLRRLQRRVGGG